MKEQRRAMDKTARPVVVRYHDGTFRMRESRGFSEAELKEAGITLADARRLSLRVDPRRKTRLDENVRTLKTLLDNVPKPTARRKPRDKR
jgi:ribosomal protein L13E